MKTLLSKDEYLLFGVYGTLIAVAVYIAFLNYGDALFTKSPKTLAQAGTPERLCLDAAAQENPHKVLFVSCSGFFDE